MSPTRVVLCLTGIISLSLEAVAQKQVCTAEVVNQDACFCENVVGYTVREGEACTAGQHCSSNGNCYNDGLNGAIGNGHLFRYEVKLDENEDMVTQNYIGFVDVSTPYLGGDPGCCKLCRENPHTAGRTTEFFNFHWNENGNNGCSCMDGLMKTDPAGPVLGYCGNDTSFLDKVDGSLGEDREYKHYTSIYPIGPIGFSNPAPPENVSDCCVRCQKVYPGQDVEMVEFERRKGGPANGCHCFKSIPGKRIETYGMGFYAGLCGDQ